MGEPLWEEAATVPVVGGEMRALESVRGFCCQDKIARGLLRPNSSAMEMYVVWSSYATW